MKFKSLIIAIILMVTTANGQIEIPSLSPATTMQQQVGLSAVTVSYHRPSLRGRKLIGEATIPFGTVWRLGANEVTTIEIKEDIEIEGNKVLKGKYALVAIPNTTEWTIILNKDEKQWGVYQYDSKKDVLRFNVKAIPLENKVETMIFSFEDVTPNTSALVFKWENSSFKILFKHDSDAKVMSAIKEATSKPKTKHIELMEAAEYYLMMNRDLEQALQWSNQVLEQVQSPFRYNLKAQIAQKLGKCDEAKAAANKTIELAKKNGDVAAISLAENIIKECTK